MKMNLGRIQGILFFAVGVIFGLMGIFMLRELGAVSRVFFSSPLLITLGIAVFIFSGYNIPLSQRKDKAKQLEVFTKAPLLHKIIWGVAFVIGVVIMFKLLIDYGLF